MGHVFSMAMLNNQRVKLEIIMMKYGGFLKMKEPCSLHHRFTKSWADLNDLG